LHLVQILLPLYDNDGARLPRALYDRVREELAGRFGGLTAFTRAPAEGHWRDAGETKRDDIVVFEVMTEDLDEAWWAAYRRELEQRFRQEAIIVRAQAVRTL
jgi:hypothetical protein